MNVVLEREIKLLDSANEILICRYKSIAGWYYGMI